MVNGGVLRQVLEGVKTRGRLFCRGLGAEWRRGLPLCRRILESFHFVGHPVLLVMIRGDLCIFTVTSFYILVRMRLGILLYSCCCEQLIAEWRGNGGEQQQCYVVERVSRHHVEQGSA